MKALKKIMAGVLAVAALSLPIQSRPLVSKAVSPFEEGAVAVEKAEARLMPVDGAPLVATFPRDTRIGVFFEEDGWYSMQYGNYRGYIKIDAVYLPSTDRLLGSVEEGGADVYSSIGEGAEPATRLNGQTSVNVIGDDGEYYLVEYGATAAPPQDGAAATDEVAGENAEAEASPTAQPASDTGGMANGYIDKDALTLSVWKNAAQTLTKGMQGAEVTTLQRELMRRGFFAGPASGEYGNPTGNAVMLFQEFAGLQADGIAGPDTLSALYSDNGAVNNFAERLGFAGSVELMPFNTVSVNYFPIGSIAKVTDVHTGISWNERRIGGKNNATTVPLTADDTANMLAAVGGEWSWDRRPVWVSVNGAVIAASMDCTPYFGSPIPDNNFAGHHSIHFYQSLVDESGKEDPRHAANVRYAYDMGQA